MAHKDPASMTLEELKKFLSYDQGTGFFTWNPGFQHGPRRIAGTVAGMIDSDGYRWIGVNCYRRVPAHRLAWFYVHGHWPKDLIDHKNGRPDDNRIENLREATRQQNLMNNAGHKRRKALLKGVYADRRPGRRKIWYASLRLNKKNIFLGYFDTMEEAHAAYTEGAIKYFGEFACDGNRGHYLPSEIKNAPIIRA